MMGHRQFIGHFSVEWLIWVLMNHCNG